MKTEGEYLIKPVTPVHPITDKVGQELSFAKNIRRKRKSKTSTQSGVLGKEDLYTPSIPKTDF